MEEGAAGITGAQPAGLLMDEEGYAQLATGVVDSGGGSRARGRHRRAFPPKMRHQQLHVPCHAHQPLTHLCRRGRYLLTFPW